MKQKSIRRFLLVSCAVGLWYSQPAAAYQNEIDQTARTIADKLQTSNAKTIAVVDFTDLNGNVTELGRFVAEELSSALAESGGLRVIDRIHLRSILQEHKLAASGVIAPETARQLGKITGVQALVTGTMTEFGDSVRLSAKVLDTETAQIYASVRTDIPKTGPIGTLANQSVGAHDRSDPPPPRPVPSEQTQQVKEFSLQLQRCNVDGSDIVCHWTITNKSQEDRNIALGSESCQIVLFDNLGREYQPTQIQVGGSSSSDATYPRIGGLPSFASSGRVKVEKTLLSLVPTPLSITFQPTGGASYQDRQRKFDSITAVKVSISQLERYRWICLDVTFRDISLVASR